MGNVLVHLVLGVVLAVAFAVLLARRPDLRPGLVPAGVLFLTALVAGLWLTATGNVLAHRPVLWAHIAAAGLGVIALGIWLWRRSAAAVGDARPGWARFRQAFVDAVGDASGDLDALTALVIANFGDPPLDFCRRPQAHPGNIVSLFHCVFRRRTHRFGHLSLGRFHALLIYVPGLPGIPFGAALGFAALRGRAIAIGCRLPAFG